MAGHIWPVFLKFRGGRGAATGVGVLIAMIPFPGIPIGLISVITLFITKNTTLAIAIVMIALPMVSFAVGVEYSVIGFSVLLSIMIGWRHYATSGKQFSRKTCNSGS